jgi:hypothetical protein
MAAFREFIETIQFPPNPNQNLDRTLPASFNGANPEKGRDAFMNKRYTLSLKCASCHSPKTSGGASFIVDGGPRQNLKVPHLRNLYQKTGMNIRSNAVSIVGFGYTHDGAFQDPFTFLSEESFDRFSKDDVVKSNLNAFLMCFDTGTAPSVGFTRTVVGSNVSTAAVSNDWSLLERQADLGTDIDLIIKGTVNGLPRGLLYQPKSRSYRPDTTNLASFTRAQLAALVQGGDTLTIMGVPPGSGLRMGIDRDLDGVLDGDLPPPVLQVSQVAGQTVITWPSGAVGFRLEATASLSSPAWIAVDSAVENTDGRTAVTISPVAGSRYFRLHQP